MMREDLCLNERGKVKIFNLLLVDSTLDVVSLSFHVDELLILELEGSLYILHFLLQEADFPLVDSYGAGVGGDVGHISINGRFYFRNLGALSRHLRLAGSQSRRTWPCAAQPSPQPSAPAC